MNLLYTTKLIREFYKPYKKIGLINFMHDITFGNGQISMLVGHKEIFLFFYQNKIPMLCTDESGRTLANGIYLNKSLEAKYKDCSILMPLMVRIGNQFGHSFGTNSLHIVVRENDCQHMYSLFFDLTDHDFLHWIINNGDFLSDLIATYNTRASDVVLEAKSPESRIILPNFNSITSYDSSSDNHNIVRLIHKKLNMPIYLTNQQSKCFRLLMLGKSAKEIAINMRLSHRTVEHYIEKIREILGCHSNKELIAAYIDQLDEKD